MNKAETIEDLYKRKFDLEPNQIPGDISHFNVFKIETFAGANNKPVPYTRRDYFKISLVSGASKIFYADKTIELQTPVMVFSNPYIPYKWEHNDSMKDSFFCIFSRQFFQLYGNLEQYDVFKPDGTHVFELTDEQFQSATVLYGRMFEEIASNYEYKYDVLRTLVFELLHFAMKTKPAENFAKHQANGPQRITTLFLELLERQFPIDNMHQTINLRSASEYAGQLNIHINHLNRAVKEITSKTTTQIIAERVLREACILLKQSAWPVADIAYALGFAEVTYFNNFFKKHAKLSPLKFRNV